jgi:hypothetical protein
MPATYTIANLSELAALFAKRGDECRERANRSAHNERVRLVAESAVWTSAAAIVQNTELVAAPAAPADVPQAGAAPIAEGALAYERATLDALAVSMQQQPAPAPDDTVPAWVRRRAFKKEAP